MTCNQPYTAFLIRALKLMSLVALFVFLVASSSYAQNTKGDRTQTQRSSKRENKFRPSKKKVKAKQSYNRVQGRRLSQASRASASRPTKIYPQRTSRSVTGKISKQNARRYSGRIQPQSATGRTRNTFPQRGKFVNNPSKRPRSVEKSVSNRSEIARLKKMSHRPDPPKRRRIVPNSVSRSYISRRSINPFAGFWNAKPRKEKAYIGDISGGPLRTKNFETKKPVLVNPTARPYKPKKRVGDRPYKGPMRPRYVTATSSGKAWRGDIAGRKIRGKNFTSKSKTEQAGGSIFPPKLKRRRVGDRPYKGSMPTGGYKSVTGKGSKRVGPIPVRTPGIGANGIGSYRGNIKGRRMFSPQGAGYTGNIKSGRPLKGGGSISGSRWNNKGLPIAVRTPRSDAAGKYQGNIKGRRMFSPQGAGYSGSIKTKKPLKGGGSISGNRWNNKGTPIAVRTPRSDAYGTYQGSIKAGRQVKGGGSISGKRWNNKGLPIAVRTPRSDAPGTYQGNIKRGRPLKGGGSISGMWNNNQRPIPNRIPAAGAEKVAGFPGKLRIFDLKPSMRNQGEEYTGSKKAKRPVKGGGSVSGKLWNNKQSPIPRRIPPAGAEKVAGFPGRMMIFDLKPSMRPQGEEYTGNIKAKKPAKGGGSVSGKLWNNNEKPIAVKTPTGKSAGEVDSFLGKAKIKKEYIKNPNASEDALKKSRPDKTTYLVNGLQIKVKQQEYKKKPNAADGTMPGIAPSKTSIKASEFSKAIKLKWNYKRNPSSSDQALKTWEPSKAFARASDYQGNIKMKKFDLFGKRQLHPDAQFVKTNKNNTDEERSMMTNFKLWWARLFKKSDTQPEHLKQKVRKPRYDKGEQGLWYD